MAQQFSRGYVARAEFAPSTLTADTVYFALRNTATQSNIINVTRFKAQLVFSGTNAATRSIFALQRMTATATGGSTLTATKLNPGSLDPDADIRAANGGLAGITASQTDRFFVFGIPSQNASVALVEMHFEDENPLILAPGDSLLLVAHNTIISGAVLAGNFLFYEVP